MKRKKAPLASLTREEYEARLKKILLAGLGKCWMFWPPRAEVKRRCAVADKPGWWKCEKCKRETERLDVDHIVPCVSTTDGWQGWDVYIDSRFVYEATKLQGLCRECHREKSKQENKRRREAKKDKTNGR